MDEKKIGMVIDKVNAKVNEASGSFIAVKSAVKIAYTIMDVLLALTFFAIYLVFAGFMQDPGELAFKLFVTCVIFELGLGFIFSFAYKAFHNKYTEFINKVAYTTAKELIGDAGDGGNSIHNIILPKINFPVAKGFMDK